MIDVSFWQGKKVFVTGHTGFKGAWLTQLLVMVGADVTGYALAPSTTPSLFQLLQLDKKIQHIEANILSFDRLKEEMIQAKPDVVIHMAAQALVRASYDEPLETFNVNVMGTAHVMEALREIDACRAAVIVTTDKCYENNDAGTFFSEEDRLGGHDPYSASKAAAELVTHAYDHSFFKNQGPAIATARAGNVLGGGDWAADRLIPDIVRAVQAGQPVSIRNPHATRPWQHVLEPIRGYLMLAEKLYKDGRRYAGSWNFGPIANDIQSVGHVLEQLREHMPFELSLDNAPQPHEAQKLGLSIDKAMRILNWSPKLPLKEGLALTGQWYKAYIDGNDVASVTNQQIKKYVGLI